MFKLFGSCWFHKWTLSKTDVKVFIDYAEEWEYYYCERCLKTKIKTKHLWSR